MEDVLKFVADNWKDIVNGAAWIVAGASMFTAVIAKHTENKFDDQVAGWLRRVYGLLRPLTINAPELPVREEYEVAFPELGLVEDDD